MVLARVAYSWSEITFSTQALRSYFQLLDPVLLQRELLKSLWYMHSQPPLFNLLIGLTLKLFPTSWKLVLKLAYAAQGIFIGNVSLWLMLRLGINRFAAMLVAAIFACSPTQVSYENSIFYTVPETFLLCCCAASLHVAYSLRSATWLAVFWMTLAALALTRSLYHLGWLVLVLLVQLWRPAISRARVLGIAAIPVLLVTGWYAKNAVLFGTFSSSSWLGMSLMKLPAVGMSMEELAGLSAEGKLSPAAAVRPFSFLQQYPESTWTSQPAFEPVRALSQPVKSTGYVNLNHYAFLQISRSCSADFRRLCHLRPGAILKGWAEAWRLFFVPQPRYFGQPGMMEQLYDRLVYWKLPAGFGSRTGITHLLYLLAYPCAVANILWLSRRTQYTGLNVATLAFILATLAYVAVVGNTVEVGENYRFRFTLDPLVLPFAFSAVAQLLHRTTRRPHADPA
jgi:hypothetical protein